MHYMDIVSYSKEAVPINIFLFKFTNRNIRKWCVLSSELTEQRGLRTFLLFTLNK